ncbi:MAG: FAD binding domain-containing protein [Burkholderiaceae bacterium]
MYPFNLSRPGSVEAAHQAAGGDARYLAGGQSLVQSMRLRLASADTLVDLGAIESLRSIEVDASTVTVGAMATHSAVARSAQVREAMPALAALAAGIGDPMVRNMGTIGGAIANADPAACYPAAVVGLDATIVTDRREISGDDFFLGLYETALEPAELVVAVRFQIPKRAAYVKFKQPASRFALVGVMVSEGANGVRVGVTGAKASAYRESTLEAALSRDFSADAIETARVSSEGMNSDLHASADYRAAMVVAMAKRAVAAAG